MEDEYIARYLLVAFLPRIKKWFEKAERSKDAFDKYISFFIATNILYGVWAKISQFRENPDKINDKKEFLNLQDLIDSKEEFILKSNIPRLVKILEEERLIVKIKVNHSNKFAQELFREHRGDSEKETEFLLETLYKVRCNLFHGEKGYEERQVKLLNHCSSILKVLIETCLDKIHSTYGYEEK